MRVTEVKNEGLQREFSVTLSAEDINKRIEGRLVQLAKQIKLPGFRPGKVPLQVVKRRHGKQILGEVLENAVSETSQKILEERSLQPALQPTIQVSSFDEGKDLVYSLALEVFPEIPEVNLETSLKLVKDVIDISKKDIEEALDRLKQANKDFVAPEKERAAASGDVVVIDFVGKIDGVAFDGGSAKGYNLELGSKQFIPGYEEQLVGAKKGEERLVKVAFPEKYGSAALAGKNAEFDVTVQDVLEAKIPEITEEFAKKFGFEDIEKLENGIKSQIKKEYEGLAHTKLKKALFDALDKLFDLDVPPAMLDMEAKSLESSLSAQDENGKDKTDKQREEERLELRDVARRRVKLGIVLAEIGRKNQIAVTEGELRKAVFEQARAYSGQEQKIIEFYQKTPGALDQLKGPILEEKVVTFILGKASLEEKNITPKELLKFFETEDLG